MTATNTTPTNDTDELDLEEEREAAYDDEAERYAEAMWDR